MRCLGLVCATLLAAFLSLTTARAETVEEFYKGKTVTVVVTGATGSIYDLSARLVTRYMSEHLPGKPTMVIKMMVGGGHLVGTNWLYNVAPRDGSVLASIGEAIPLTQVLEPEKVKFDVSKFNWLGNPGLSNLVLSTWADKGDYDRTAAKLVDLFVENFAEFAEHVDEGVRQSGPQVTAAA